MKHAITTRALAVELGLSVPTSAATKIAFRGATAFKLRARVLGALLVAFGCLHQGCSVDGLDEEDPAEVVSEEDLQTVEQKITYPQCNWLQATMLNVGHQEALTNVDRAIKNFTRSPYREAFARFFGGAVAETAANTPAAAALNYLKRMREVLQNNKISFNCRPQYDTATDSCKRHTYGTTKAYVETSQYGSAQPRIVVCPDFFTLPVTTFDFCSNKSIAGAIIHELAHSVLQSRTDIYNECSAEKVRYWTAVNNADSYRLFVMNPVSPDEACPPEVAYEFANPSCL